MASRGGHKTTSDGTDYNSREKVRQTLEIIFSLTSLQIATHYAASATGKSRLRMLLGVHYLVGGLHLARLLPSLFYLLDIPANLPLPSAPLAQPQEFLWLLSLPFTLLARSAINKSNSTNLRLFQYILIGTCVLPVLLTLYHLLPTTIAFFTSEEEIKGQETVISGLPFAPLWFAFLLFCQLVHLAQLVVIRSCLTAWAPRYGKHQ